MEQIKQVELMLWDLPTLVFEEILLYLNIRDRKNIRLTCKRLYKLCNSPRICMKENIIWRMINIKVVNMQLALLPIGRSCYNLVIDCHYGALSNLQKSTILQFFEVNGAKIRSLVIERGHFDEGFLEPLIISCEDLQSLTLSLTTRGDSSSLDYFTLEPNTVTRPTVTYLELILPKHQPSKYFHRMLSVFPNVKHLKIVLEHVLWEGITSTLHLETAQECSAIFDDIMKCGSNLESLHLNIPLSQLIAKGSQFSKTLSNLKDFSINFNYDATLNKPENLYLCFSNLTSLELLNTGSYQLSQLTRVLENTQLNYLKIFSNGYRTSMDFNEESFKALVSSKLKIVRLKAETIQGLPLEVFDFQLEANRTVTDLYLGSYIVSSVQLFSMYFHGLVHLTITNPTDEILQCIFQYQQNLRSLELGDCIRCTKKGFCGSNGGRFEYSMNNLQKLEHLSIGSISMKIITSDSFKNMFTFPLLKYLHIDYVFATPYYQCCARLCPGLYENLTHLRALRCRDMTLPSPRTISSLFTNLKHLDYLRFDPDRGVSRTHPVIFINSKELSINTEDYKYNHLLGEKEFSVNIVNYRREYPSGVSYYDKKLNRMVMLNDYTGKKLRFPEISSYEIDWIEA